MHNDAVTAAVVGLILGARSLGRPGTSCSSSPGGLAAGGFAGAVA